MIDLKWAGVWYLRLCLKCVRRALWCSTLRRSENRSCESDESKGEKFHVNFVESKEGS